MIEFNKSNIRIWSRLGSCGAYGMTMCELPVEDDKVVAITADLCFYSGLDRFKQKYPDRLYNVGIAEQNLIGVAGGMASEGLNVFASTYASFAVTRALDQVKVNMGYMNLPIKLIGLTSGLSVSILGATHMCYEDIAIIRSLPNIVILSPADCTETVKATIAASKYNGPVYLRLSGTMNAPIVYNEDYDFELGKAIKLKQGKDVTIIATGTMVYNSIKAAEELEEDGISCTVIDMHTIRPLDTKILDIECKSAKMIVTVEEHGVFGGLGAAISDYYADKMCCPIYKIGLSDEYKHAGTYDKLIEDTGLSIKSIKDKVKQLYSLL